MTIPIGSIIKIKPDYQDPGDDKYKWHTISIVEKGRVDIQPKDINLTYKPIYTVPVSWIEASYE